MGGDLEPPTLLAAYRTGLFPMRVGGLSGPLGWWSPDPRGVLPPEGLIVPRSLRRSRRRFTVTVDAAFDEVIAACADQPRPGAWIGPEFIDAYRRLHRMGWAHSVEAWDAEGNLAGGLYGVCVGALFAGESMFHRRTDASKVALVGLVELVADTPGLLIDVQWRTPHLARLGVVDIPRDRYLDLLEVAVSSPAPPVFSDPAP